MKGVSRAWVATRTWLMALLPILPAAAAIATAVLFFADWPDRGNRDLQLAVALGVAVVLWVISALLLGPEVTEVESASSDSYEDLRGRVLTLEADLDALGEHGALRPSGAQALAEARVLLSTLKSDLRLGEHNGRGLGMRWLHGHGYVNAWRELHAAEDCLLVVEDPQVAMSRLTDPDLVELGRRIDPQSGLPTVEKFEAHGGRELVSRRYAELHRVENDAWDKIVNLRNRLFLTLVLAITLTYSVLAFAVLRDVTVTMMTAGIAFFLVGAVVGVFNELYLTSRPTRKGSVFDYGLGHIRLLVTPVLSGLAALGGILITTMAGPFLVATGGAATSPDLTAVFSLQTYSMGLVVAAIFGLTPGLLLSRLRDRTDAYTKEIEQAAPATATAKPVGKAKPPLVPVG